MSLKNINDILPDNVLVIIFEYLSPQEKIRIEKVCKRWEELSKNAWTKFTVMKCSSSFPSKYIPKNSMINAALNPDSLKSLLRRCGKYLKEINLTLNKPIDKMPRVDHILPIVSRYCPNLEVISLTGFPMGSSALRNLIGHCSQLKTLELRNCFHDQFTDNQLRYFLENYQNLTCLDLRDNYSISGNCLNFINNDLKRLGLSFHDLTNEGIKAIVENCPNVEELLFRCETWRHEASITNECLEEAFQKLPNLRTLALPLEKRKPMWSTLFGKLSNLQELDLRRTNKFDDDALLVISRSCCYLKVLIINPSFELTDNALFYLRRLPYLTELHLNFCRKLTSDCTEILAKLPLEILSLQFSEHISDDSMVHLAGECKSLKKLDVSGSGKITDATVSIFYNSIDKRASQLTLLAKFTGITKEKCEENQHPMLKILRWY